MPPVFGTYDAISFASSPSRGPLSYPPDWQDYHCALVDPAYPSIDG